MAEMTSVCGYSVIGEIGPAAAEGGGGNATQRLCALLRVIMQLCMCMLLAALHENIWRYRCWACLISADD